MASSLPLAARDDDESAPLSSVMEGARLSLKLTDDDLSLDDNTQQVQPTPFKNPQCCLKPFKTAVPTIMYPQVNLDGEFRALSKRSGSTSTPFVTRTSRTASSTPLTPFCSESETSLNDSAIEATQSSLSSAFSHVQSSHFHSSIPPKKSQTQRFDSIAEHEDLPSLAIPKAVLFPSGYTDCDASSSRHDTSTSQIITEKQTLRRSSTDQCVPCISIKRSHDGEQFDHCAQFHNSSSAPSSSTSSSHHLLSPPSHLPSVIRRPSSFTDIRKHDLGHHSSDLSNKTPSSSFEGDYYSMFGSSLNTPDTGYESQLSYDTPSSIENFSMCMSQIASKNKDRLIGRKIGLDFVDIVGQLHAWNQYNPLKMIMKHLSKQDLKNMCAVSDDWNSVVFSDLEACRRKMSPKAGSKKMNAQKENHNENVLQENVKKRDCHNLTTPRSLLSVVQEMAPPTPYTPCLSMSTPDCSQAKAALDLSQKYWKEAELLKNEECLRKCPKCRSPSKVNPTQERAWCSNENCSFDFCIKCHGAFHGSKDCGMKATSKKPKTDTTVGSKRSKKNLRRL